MKLSAGDLIELGVIDEIVPEPPGGAHHAPAEAARALGDAIARHLRPLLKLTPASIRRRREDRIAAIGAAFINHQSR